MAIITLTTDWRGDDFYKGSVTGAILSGCIDARIVDITHQVSPFSSTQAAFILKKRFSPLSPRVGSYTRCKQRGIGATQTHCF
jgi:S-adenosylmethionine hydrolase